MRIAFLNDCGPYVEDAWNDTSRWVKPELYKEATYCSSTTLSYLVNAAYAQCPVAKCGMYDDGDSWNTTTWYFGTYDEESMTTTSEYYYCETCTCNNDQFSANTSGEVTCSTTDYSTVSDISECGENSGPSSGAMNCSSDANGNDEIDDTINGRLYDITVCSTPSQYCSWSKANLPAGFDPDTVCRVDNFPSGDPSWGCQDDSICIAAFTYDALEESETGFCAYNEVSITQSEFDCVNFDWKSETYTIKSNFMCCGQAAGDLCNQQVNFF